MACPVLDSKLNHVFIASARRPPNHISLVQVSNAVNVSAGVEEDRTLSRFPVAAAKCRGLALSPTSRTFGSAPCAMSSRSASGWRTARCSPVLPVATRSRVRPGSLLQELAQCLDVPGGARPHESGDIWSAPPVDLCLQGSPAREPVFPRNGELCGCELRPPDSLSAAQPAAPLQAFLGTRVTRVRGD